MVFNICLWAVEPGSCFLRLEFLCGVQTGYFMLWSFTAGADE